MEVVDPDEVPWATGLEHHVAKRLVGLRVAAPGGRADADGRLEAMQNWPQHGVGDALVEALPIATRQGHGGGAVVGIGRGLRAGSLTLALLCADPNTPALAQHRIERGHQSARPTHLPAFARNGHGSEWTAVTDDHKFGF